MGDLTERQKKDVQVLVTFVQIYCAAKHGRNDSAMKLSLGPEELGVAMKGDVRLCCECAALVAYAVEKRRKCPLDPKPSCKNCPIHCYGKDYRARIKEVMAFSGKRMILRGRLDLLWHYLF